MNSQEADIDQDQLLAGQDPSDKTSTHALGMWVFLITLSVLFATSMIGYFLMMWLLASRTEYVDNAGDTIQLPPMPDLPHLPYLLWASTLAILLSSATIQWALSSVRKDDNRGLVRGLLATAALGGVFLVLQTICWIDWMRRAVDVMVDHQAYRFAVSAFLVLSGLHAVHLIGGLAPLIYVTRRAATRVYTTGRHIGVHHLTLYWHFLDIVWVIIFTSLLLFT